MGVSDARTRALPCGRGEAVRREAAEGAFGQSRCVYSILLHVCSVLLHVCSICSQISLHLSGAVEWFRPIGIDYMSEINVSHSKPMPLAQQRRQRLAFLAAVSHIDDQVGLLLDVLITLGVDNDTTVVLTADHGQSLGEGNMWEMMNLLEQSLRVPLLIRPAPNDQRLRRTVAVYPHPVELLDLFPTLATLAGVPPPPEIWRLPGTDLTTGMLSGGVVKPLDAAYGQITRCINCSMAYSFSSGLTACAKDRAEDAPLYLTPCAETPRQLIDWMGFSVRTGDWRYSLFCRWNGTELRPTFDDCATFY